LVVVVTTLSSCIGLQARIVRKAQKWIAFNDELRINNEKRDDFFMQLALNEARRGADKFREVPVGCVVVQTKTTGNASHHYRTLASAHNQVERLCDASAHAELLALRQAGRAMRNWRLSNPRDASIVTSLYCTCEPCLTCMSACHAFRVQRVVYGADDLRLGAFTVFRQNISNEIAASSYTSATTLSQHPFHRISEVKAGIRGEESSELLREFFRRRRKEPRWEAMGAKRFWMNQFEWMKDCILSSRP
jgi:tRNA(adenine34) deaminase